MHSDVATNLENIFLSTPSARRATYAFKSGFARFSISIHALREEGDDPVRVLCNPFLIFLSTPSARRATVFNLENFFNGDDFYPRPPRGGRRSRRCRCCRSRPISIHALREEGDVDEAEVVAQPVVISIHALREEGDAITPHLLRSRRNFYPRPPRGGRPRVVGREIAVTQISIHALREEGDWRLSPCGWSR